MSLDFSMINFFVYSFVSLFIIINPFSTASIFLTLSEGIKKQEKKKIIFGSVLFSFLTLVLFGFLGYYIFKFFGITIGAFKIAGGIILIKVAMNLLKGEHRKIHESHTEDEDIMIVPLAIPFLAGPGAITTMMVLVNDNHGIINILIVLISLILNMILAYVILLKSEAIDDKLQERDLRAINKIMGIILLAIAIQFFVNGLIDIIPLILSSL